MSKQHSSSKPTAGKPAAFAWAKLDRTPVPYNEDADVDMILSYATATCGGNGLVAVECIARELMNAGIRPFHGRMVPAGMNWQEAWYGELDDAKGAIMLLSEDYFKSGVCVDELIAILKRMPKNIIPVCLGPVQMGKGFLGPSKQERKQASFIRAKLDGNYLPPPDLGVFQDNWAGNVQELIRRVEAMLGSVSTRTQVPSTDLKQEILNLEISGNVNVSPPLQTETRVQEQPSTPCAPTDVIFEVKGCPEGKVNGYYKKSGTKYNKPKYKHESHDIEIGYAADVDPGWFVGYGGWFDECRWGWFDEWWFVGPDSSSPPESGWKYNGEPCLEMKLSYFRH